MLLTSLSEDLECRGDLEGRYANSFKVGHNAYEFVIDFGQCYADDEQREYIHSRIVTGPAYAKRLLVTLSRSINQYETEHGEINERG